MSPSHSNIYLYSFRPETLACRPNTTAPSTCLTPPQLHTLSRLYSPYIDPNGTYLSSGFVPGAEYAYPLGLVGTEPFPMPADYYRYLVLNDTTWDESRLDEETVQLGIDLNPGSMDVSLGGGHALGRRIGAYNLPKRYTSRT